MFSLKELYQDIILEHGKNPRNFGKLKTADFIAEASNPVCGDGYRVYLKISQNTIKDISFDGEGCLISKASASLMTEILKNKTIKDAVEVFNRFKRLLKRGTSKNTGKLAVFSGIYKFPARIQCALLPWYIIKKRF